MKTISIITLLFNLISTFLFSQMDIDYLGQAPPGDSAIIFAPGIISVKGRFERSIAFSPDSNELFYTVTNSDWRPTLMQMKRINGDWTKPLTAPFANKNNNCDPSFSKDGQKLYFASNRSPGSEPYNFDIWVSEKKDTTWDEPIYLDNVNTDAWDYHPSVTANGTLYFLSYRSGGLGGSDIYTAKFIDNQYETAINLGKPINSSSIDNQPYIASDESYLIFSSDRPGGYGAYDLYISFRKSDKTWTNPKNFGPTINSSDFECDADISVDGKYLFFAKRKALIEMDIYWVSSRIVDSLKNTNFVPYVKHDIPNQTDTAGNIFSYTIPDTIFVDDDNEPLTLAASLSNGNDLPDSLSFDSFTNTISGKLMGEGIYNIKLTATDAAGASVSNIFRLTIKQGTTAITNINANEILVVFPNPSKQTIQIKVNEQLLYIEDFEILDLNGKIVKQGTFKSEIIDISDLSKGFYLINLRTYKDIISKKIMVE